MSKIYIIIVNWNSYNEVAECVDSLRRIDYSDYQVIIVDNGSIDESKDLICMHYPEIILLEHESNLGLAAANNTGIRYCLDHGAEFCLILNNDTVVDAAILKEFVLAAEKNPEAGLFGAKIYYYHDPNRIWWAQPVWNAQKSCFNNIGCDEVDDGIVCSKVTDIVYANGCALFFRMAVARTIGLMDERFFIYYEEIDWCYRAQHFGYKILFVPTAKLWHKVSASSGGQYSPVEAYFKVRNYFLWTHKNLPSPAYCPFFKKYLPKILHLFHFTLHKENASLFRRIYKDIKNFCSSTTIARLQGTMDYFRGRFGDCPKYVRKL